MVCFSICPRSLKESRHNSWRLVEHESVSSNTILRTLIHFTLVKETRRDHDEGRALYTLQSVLGSFSLILTQCQEQTVTGA